MADGPTAAGLSVVTVTEKDGDDRHIDNFGVANSASPTGFAERQAVWDRGPGGTWAYEAGASGTVSVPSDARVLLVTAGASSTASMTIDGGDSIPIPADRTFDRDFHGRLAGPLDIVFTGTDSFYVDWVL